MPSDRVKSFIVILILATTATMGYILTEQSLFPVYLAKPFQMAVSILIGLVFYYFISGLSPAIKDRRMRFTLRKIAAFIAVSVILVGFLATWIHEVTILALSAGLVAAGVSFSLREPITSLVGWFIIIFNRPFSVGDRINMNAVEGDVIDYNLFQIKLMEIGQWTDSNMYTGRILSAPTSWVLTHSIYNYTQDFSFIWDRIWVGLLYGENYEKVSADLKEITEKHVQDIVEGAERSYKRLSKKYFSHVSNFEPSVYLSFNSNWVELNIRYVTDARTRTRTRSMISRDILDYISKNGIRVASTSMNINLTGEEKS